MTRSAHRSFAWLFFTLAATACGPTISVIPLVNDWDAGVAPRPPESVEVFWDDVDARGGHRAVSLIEVENHPIGGTEAFLRLLRQEAGEMGCDAVQIKDVDRFRRSDLLRDDEARVVVRALCIVYGIR